MFVKFRYFFKFFILSFIIYGLPFSGNTEAKFSQSGQLELDSGYVDIQRGGKIFRHNSSKEPLQVYTNDIITTSDNAIAVVYLEYLVEVLDAGTVWKIPPPPVKKPANHNNTISLLAQLFRWQPTSNSRLGGTKSTNNKTKTLKTILPRHNSKILSDRPAVIWNQSNSTYEVSVFYRDNIVYTKMVSGQNYLRFPNQIKSLARDNEYYWEVTDQNNPKLNDSSIFYVLGRHDKNTAEHDANQLRKRLVAEGYPGDTISIAVASALKNKGHEHAAMQELLNSLIKHPNSRKLHYLISKWKGE